MLFLRLVGQFESGNASGVKTIKCTVIEKHTHLSPFKTNCHMFIFNSLQDLQEWPVPSERDRSLSQQRHLTVCHDTNRTATGRKLFKQHGCIGAVCLRLQESMWRLLPGGPKLVFVLKSSFPTRGDDCVASLTIPTGFFFFVVFFFFFMDFLWRWMLNGTRLTEEWMRIMK